MILYFHKIHPFNFFLAQVARCFFEVRFWRLEKVPVAWVKSLVRLDPADFFTHDDWKSSHEEVFTWWKEFVKKYSKHQRDFIVRSHQLEIDLFPNWLQWLASRYEEEFLFLKLVEKSAVKSANSITQTVWVSGTLAPHFKKKFLMKFPETAGVRTRALMVFLDWLWHWFLFLAQISNQFKILFYHSHCRALFDHSYKYLWFGISPSEIPTKLNQLDFAFLSNRGKIAADQSLYLLPTQHTHLHSEQGQNLHTALVNRFSSLLPLKDRMMSFIEIIKQATKIFFVNANRPIVPSLLNLTIQAIPWIFVGKRYQPSAFLSSVSASWPESPAVSVMNALGVKTIIWHYSANVFGFAYQLQDFNDLAVTLSVSASKYTYVWNQEVINFLKTRVVMPAAKSPRYATTGPVMCGDSQWLNYSPSQVREMQQIRDLNSYYVSVFDVSPIAKATRLQMGFGPNVYPLKMLEKFFDDLYELLKKNSKIRLILKPKRALNDPQREYPKKIWELLNEDRVIMLDHKIDPYLPIAMADLCIGLPFTSPVIAGLRTGRAGIFHDPLGTIRCIRSKAMLPLFTHGSQELQSRVNLYSHGGSIPIEQDVLLPQGDPTELFAELLQKI